jgi:DNA-binding winged helix-turn-helix (wHTH) protein/TolB-like protein/Tfp pilus assembly protein PilF
MSLQTRELYEFGDFRLDGVRRLVTRGEEPVRLHSRAFDTLLILVRNRNRVVAKDELMQILWPDTFVEEVNLAQNISALRKALGETPGENRFIATIPGKGYQFVCEVRETGGSGDEVVVARHSRAQLIVEETAVGGEDRGELLQLPAPRSSLLSGWVVWGVLAVVLGVGAAGGYWIEHRRAVEGTQATAHSIAVLPFQPLVAGTDDEHLGLGMADAVITKLSNIRQLPVRPTDVVIRYSEPGVDPLRAAREMGVDTVLTGKLQKSGDRVRVTVQLVRVNDGRALWAETFEDKYTGIFGVEDSISEKVAQALAINVAGREKLQIERHYTEDIDAYRNYLKGRYEEFTFTPDGMYKAIEYFNHAIAEDPGYALAYAGLADAYTTESDWLLPPREALPKADAAARKALAFDDRLAEAHGALAHALLHEWKLAESDREFHTALALDPSYVSTYFAYGEYLASIGHADQAVAIMKKALTLDPLSPEINSFLAWDYYLERDYQGCLEQSHKAMQMFPDFWVPHMAAGMCYYSESQFQQAAEEYQKALGMNPESTFSQAGVGMCLAKQGKRAAALEALDRLQAMKNQTYVSPVYVALVYLALGDRDAEFRWLEKGYDDRAEWLLWLTVDPLFDAEHGDPRFEELVRKVGV